MFWTYENWVHRYARVHKSACSHCNGGRGTHQTVDSHAGRWLGPIDLYIDAVKATKYQAAPCGHCVPSA